MRPEVLKKGMGLLMLLFAFVLQSFAQSTKAEGMLALEKQEYAKAASIFSSLISANPRDAELYYLLGRTQLESEDLTAAAVTFNKGIITNVKYPMNYVGLGTVQMMNKEVTEARKNFDKALDLTQENSVEVLTTVADAYISGSASDLDEATKLLTKAKLLDSKNVNIYIGLGDVWLKQKVDESALTNYQKAIELDKTFLKGYLRVGQLHVKAGQYNEGADAFRKAIEIDPNYAPVYRELGELYYKAKKYEQAKENYRKYVELTKNDLNARARYASFLYLSKDYAEAISEINSVLKDTTTNVLVRLLGYSYLETGDAANARKYMDEYFKRIPENHIIASDYEYYARILEKQGMDAEAIAYFEKAMLLDSTRFNLHGDIAQNYIRQKKYPEAVREYALIVEKNPGYKEHYDLGKTYYYMKEFEKADSLFTKMTTIRPDIYLGWFWSGSAKAAIENKTDSGPGAAVAEFQKVVDILAATPEKYKNDFIKANSYLAYYYYEQKDYPAATRYAETIIALDPTNSQATEMLKFMKQ